jgi:hypothetical protein
MNVEPEGVDKVDEMVHVNLFGTVDPASWSQVVGHAHFIGNRSSANSFGFGELFDASIVILIRHRYRCVKINIKCFKKEHKLLRNSNILCSFAL